MTKPTAVIIGAGYGGMALANILGRSGYRVDVYEKNDAVGGRIAVVEQDGFTFDLGPSWYLMPEVFETYYQLFGESAAERLDLIRFQPGYQVFFEHETSAIIQGDVEKDKTIFERIEKGAGHKLERHVTTSSVAYRLAVKHFLYNNHFRLRDVLNMEVMKHAPKMLGLVMQNLDHYVNKHFKELRLRQLLEYHMVFLGSSPFQAPAIYTLMSHLDFKSGVFYPRRGMSSLAQDMLLLGDAYDITYHYSQPVAKIIIEQGAAKGVELEDGSEVRADVVISNADLQHTETRLLSKEHQSFPESYWQKRQPGPGALLISLGAKGELPQLLHHNLYFVQNWRDNFADIYERARIPDHASLYICNPTKTDKNLAPPDHENLFILLPIPAGIELSEGEQQALVDRRIQTVADAVEISDLQERIVTQHIFGPSNFASQFNAWQFNAFGGESHILRQSISFRTSNQSRKVKGLYYVGAGTLPGIGLPMCLIGAQLTYKRIVGDRSSGPLREDAV